MLTQTKETKAGRPSRGFTIIEVMIVLAIAGLILLIVFLAVPALQRGSRNTQRKNDAAALGAAVANAISNNGGALPVGVANDASTNVVDVCITGGATQASGTACTGNLETAKLGYYKQSNIYIFPSPGSAAVTAVAVGSETNKKVSTETMTVDVGYTCNATNTGVGTVSSRSAAVLYATETGNAPGNLQCVEQ